jgi:hypothetical protein
MRFEDLQHQNSEIEKQKHSYLLALKVWKNYYDMLTRTTAEKNNEKNTINQNGFVWTATF